MLLKRTCGGCGGEFYEDPELAPQSKGICPYCHPEYTHGVTYAQYHRGFGVGGDLPGRNAGK
jgi:hypothetical protein